MGGFFGVASKEDCVFDLFLERITILIWEQDGPVWLSMKRDVGLTVPSTILKMHLSVPNLTKRSRK